MIKYLVIPIILALHSLDSNISPALNLAFLDGFSAIAAGLSVADSVFGGLSRAGTADKQKKHVKAQISKLKESKGLLRSIYGAKREGVVSAAGREITSVRDRYDRSISQSGLAVNSSISNNLDYDVSGLKNKAQMAIGDLVGQEQDESNQLDINIEQAKGNLDLVNQQSKFLGLF